MVDEKDAKTGQCPVCGQAFSISASGITRSSSQDSSSIPGEGGPTLDSSSPPQKSTNKRSGGSVVADILGIFSVLFGVVSCLIQLIGGLCCGWIGWPVSFIALLTGILAIVLGDRKYQKVLGAAGIFLSILGFVLQVFGIACLSAWFSEKHQQLNTIR
jgi:hypothetical protein